MKTDEKDRIALHLTILALFMLAVFFMNGLYLQRSKEPPYASGIDFCLKSLELYRDLKDGDIFSFWTAPGNFYAPGAFQLTALFYLFLGPGIAPAVGVQWIFLTVLAISVFFLVREIQDKNAGLLSAFIAVSFAGTAFNSRIPNLDIPVAAFVPLTLYFLIKSKNFTDSKYSLLTAISFSLGMLAKWSFLIYLAFPLIVAVLWEIWKNHKEAEFKRHLLLSVILSAILWVFGAGLSLMLNRASSNPAFSEWAYIVFIFLTAVSLGVLYLKGKKMHPFAKNLLGFNLLCWGANAHFLLFHLFSMGEVYRITFWQVQYRLLKITRTPYHFFVDFFVFKFTGVFFFILFAVGLAVYLKTGLKNKIPAIMAGSLVFSSVLLYLQPVYDPRYFIPFSGIMAYFCAFWIPSLKIRSIRVSLLLFVMFFGFSHLFGWALLPRELAESVSRWSILTGSPVNKTNRLDEASNWLLDQCWPAPLPGTLLVFYDESGSGAINPLLILYHLKLRQRADSEISFLFRGADPIYPYRNLPWGVLVGPSLGERDNMDEENLFPWDTGRSSLGPGATDTALKNYLEGAVVGKIDIDDVILCRFRSVSNEADNTESPEDSRIARLNRIPMYEMTGNSPLPEKTEIKSGIPQIAPSPDLPPVMESGTKKFGTTGTRQDPVIGLLLRELHPETQKRAIKVEFLRSMQILNSVHMDVYRVHFLIIK